MDWSLTPVITKRRGIFSAFMRLRMKSSTPHPSMRGISRSRKMIEYSFCLRHLTASAPFAASSKAKPFADSKFAIR